MAYLVRDAEPDRADADDLLRDDDPCAISSLDDARLRAVEIAVDDLGAEYVRKLFDVDLTCTVCGLRGERRGRRDRLRAARSVTRGFGRLFVGRPIPTRSAAITTRPSGR